MCVYMSAELDFIHSSPFMTYLLNTARGQTYGSDPLAYSMAEYFRLSGFSTASGKKSEHVEDLEGTPFLLHPKKNFQLSVMYD